MILRGMRRFAEAADAFDRYVDIFTDVRDTGQGRWARAEADFLRTFGDRRRWMYRTVTRWFTISVLACHDKIVVRGRVNGSDPVELVVDTGAEQMVLSQETAAAG